MNLLTAKFNEIEHVHRIRANATLPRRTMFSFVENFKYTPYVTVPGFPRLENGMRVVAVLREEGNWKSLVGWRDLETGEVAVPDPSWHAGRALFVLVWAAAVATLVWPKEIDDLSSFFLPIGAGAMAIAVATHESVKWLRVKRDVNAVKTMTSGDHAA